MTNLNRAKLPKSIYFLLLGQGVNLITAVLSVTVAAAVGLSLSSNPAWATFPYGLQFLAILLSTFLVSAGMSRYGRYAVFNVGIVFLFSAGVLGYFAITEQQFWLLCLSHFLLGLFISTANFYRFAATDGLASELVAKASSLVISGGVIAALVAPLLAIKFARFEGWPEYSLIYLVFSVLALLLWLIIFLWHVRTPVLSTSKVSSPTAKRESLPYTLIAIGMIGGAMGYYLMNLMMIVTSLYLKKDHSFEYASMAIQMHVLAMFVPSFFVARIIKFVGVMDTVVLGFLLIAAASLLPLIFSQTYFINIALIFLGLGWNFCYSAGSALIAGVNTANKSKVQGISETLIALCATLGAFLPAPLFTAFGWSTMNLMALILALSFAVIVWILKKITKEQN